MNGSKVGHLACGCWAISRGLQAFGIGGRRERLPSTGDDFFFSFYVFFYFDLNEKIIFFNWFQLFFLNSFLLNRSLRISWIVKAVQHFENEEIIDEPSTNIINIFFKYRNWHKDQGWHGCIYQIINGDFGSNMIQSSIRSVLIFWFMILIVIFLNPESGDTILRQRI